MLDTQTEPQPTHVDGTEGWIRLARAGAIAMAVWMVLLTIMARSAIPPVIVIGLIAAVFASVLRGGRRKTALGGAVFALMALFGNLPGVIDELSNPESTPAFILTTLVTVGGILMTVGGIGVFFGWDGAPVRMLGIGAAGLTVTLAAFSFVAGALTESADQASADVPVTLEQIAFQPSTVSVAETGTLWIDNRDGIRHTFTVEALGLDLEVPALKARQLAVTGAPGTYDVICAVPGHESMTATLVIEG